MSIFEGKKVIIFDFDGVILDSMPVRDFGFRQVLSNYPTDKVEALIKYHRENGGLSRFNKIKYFYNSILQSDIDEQTLKSYTDEFSILMKNELCKKVYLIEDCISFIKSNYEKYKMFIASGSEQNELRYLCEELDLTKYFEGIYGSPTHKNELVKNIIDLNSYERNHYVLIGDSINDLEAAEENDIEFLAYNNSELVSLTDDYIESFSLLNIS